MPTAREFGKRGPPQAADHAAPVKRSGHVALLLMGTIAVGGGAYALMPSENCPPNQPGVTATPEATGDCAPRRSSSSWRYGGWGSASSSRISFFSGDNGSGASGSSVSDAGSGHVARGGFGSFAQSFAAHFSGGG